MNIANMIKVCAFIGVHPDGYTTPLDCPCVVVSRKHLLKHIVLIWKSVMATPRTRELAIYDGQECIGTIKVAEDGTAHAFDPRGKHLGSFPSLKSASAAFDSRVERTARQT